MKAAFSLAFEAAREAVRAYPTALSATGLPQLAALAALAASPFWDVPQEAAVGGFFLVTFVCGVAACLTGQAMAQGVPVPAGPFAILVRPRFWKYFAFSFVPVALSLFAALVAYAAAAAAAGFAVGVPQDDAAALMIAAPAGLAALAAGAWVTARLFLVMPAMAAGGAFSIEDSWRSTRGRAAGLVGAMALVTLPMAAAQAAIGASGAESAALKACLAVALVAVSVAHYAFYGSLGGVAARRFAGEARPA